LTCPDLAGPLARTAAGRGLHIDRRLLSGAALRTAAAVYLCGLLLWLALGLLPYLVEAIPAARHLATGLAQGHGALAPDAQRILGAGITGMGAGPGNMAGMTGGTSSTPSIAGVAFQYLFSLVNLAMGALLLARRFDDLVARLMALALLGTAATFNGPSHAVFHEISANGLVTVVHFTFHIVSGTAYLWAVVLFPDGEFPRPLRSMPLRRAFVTAVTVTITVVCWRSSFVAHPPFFVVFFGILVPLAGMAAQTDRLRHPGSPEQQQQARLLRSALLPALLTAVLWLAVRAAVLAGGATAATARDWDLRIEGWFPAVFVLVPVVLFAGILRYRLWDLDVLLGRTLVYGSLTAVVSAAYVAGVVLAGRTAGTGTVGVVLVMAAVGLAVAPVRSVLQALANRVVFGQALSPIEAMRQLAEGLSHLSPAQEMQELARVVVEATRAVTSARIWLVVDDRLVAVTHWPPDSQDARQELPLHGADRDEDILAAVRTAEGHRAIALRHQGRLLALLDTTVRRDVPLSPDEERLLEDLAGHAGLLVHNARLTAELARHVEQLSEQAAELRLSRSRVVAAQDAERRSLERDLHDGAQQDLLSLIVAMRTLRATDTAPDRADRRELARRLAELSTGLRSTGQTLGDLCGTGLPQALLDGGLLGALEAIATTTRRNGPDVDVSVEAPAWIAPRLEAAVYFCCAEALQNATKHAHATRIVVSVSADIPAAGPGGAPVLEFAVIDDGVGFDPKRAARSSGLANMEDRLSPFAGSLTVLTAPGRGTCVRGSVPLGPSTGAAGSELPSQVAR
jgi:signal transduction histidine kinase